ESLLRHQQIIGSLFDCSHSDRQRFGMKVTSARVGQAFFAMELQITAFPILALHDGAILLALFADDGQYGSNQLLRKKRKVFVQRRAYRPHHRRYARDRARWKVSSAYRIHWTSNLRTSSQAIPRESCPSTPRVRNALGRVDR